MPQMLPITVVVAEAVETETGAQAKGAHATGDESDAETGETSIFSELFRVGPRKRSGGGTGTACIAPPHSASAERHKPRSLAVANGSKPAALASPLAQASGSCNVLFLVTWVCLFF